MLLELSITDFAIIERSTIQFSEGLNALTGETGAGKSILLDALGAVLGSRVSSDSVRSGAKVARVEAAFAGEALGSEAIQGTVAGLGIDTELDDTLILSREIQANGRSSARINGRLATATALVELGAQLVDIHGQSDHLAILRTSEQRLLLDRFASLEGQRHELAANVREWRAIRSRIDELTRNTRERAQQIDLLTFQIDEIEMAALSAGEDESLVAERDILRNADRLRADAAEALALLAGDDPLEGATATTLLRAATSRTADITTLDATASELGERANELLILAEDLARDLRSYAENVESDDQRLTEIEDRIDAIQRLKRKYGATIEEVLAFGEAARLDLERLSSSENDIAALQEREVELLETLTRLATALSAQRSEAASALAAAIEQSVADLNMGRSQVRIDVRQRDDPAGIPLDSTQPPRTVHLDETGIDEVEFMIAPNAGEILKPLGRIASGGETARLMLAMKSILSEVDRTPTLVFDEIDVGVGGRAGQVVGEKLWGIARRHQVIVVSHLPQVAAFAETHLRIEKRTVGGRTVSEVRTLDETDRELELAAMLDGLPITETARQSARSMLDRSRSFISAAAGA